MSTVHYKLLTEEVTLTSLEIIPREDKVYYLASPFTAKSKDLERQRYEDVEYAAHLLYERGYVLIEPIASAYSKSLRFNLPSDYNYWAERDRKLIEISDGIIIANIDGWLESVGVLDEMVHAIRLGKPVYLFTYKTGEMI